MKNGQKKLMPFKLAKETIVKLNSSQLKEVRGGAPSEKTSSAAEGHQSSIDTSDNVMCVTFRCGLN